MSLRAEQVHFPRPSDGRTLTHVDWVPVLYRNVISVIKNPFYAGAYAYGKSGKQMTIVDGRAGKSYEHRKSFEQWDVLLREHHEGYIERTEFERNQKQLAINAYGQPGDGHVVAAHCLRDCSHVCAADIVCLPSPKRSYA